MDDLSKSDGPNSEAFCANDDMKTQPVATTGNSNRDINTVIPTVKIQPKRNGWSILTLALGIASFMPFVVRFFIDFILTPFFASGLPTNTAFSLFFMMFLGMMYTPNLILVFVTFASAICFIFSKKPARKSDRVRTIIGIILAGLTLISWLLMLVFSA